MQIAKRVLEYLCWWLLEATFSHCGAGSYNRTKQSDRFVDQQPDSEARMPYMPSESLVELCFEAD